MDGHVFVIHGSLVDLHADAVLVPCDIDGDVREHWGRFYVAGDAARELAREIAQAQGVSRVRRTEDGQIYRYVDTGATRQTADQGWLGQRVALGLRAIAEDAAGIPHRLTRRQLPLVALPMLGTGAGGFDLIRGEALFAILREARVVARRTGVDVVIVCWNRSDYVALQRQRQLEDWDWSNAEHLPQAVRGLAEQAIDQRLVLFFGAGLSAAAGLNDFEGLVSGLEHSYGMFPPPGVDLPTRVQRLRDHRRGDELKRRVREHLDAQRYSMTHGLLASLRVREAITTNFDQLYELAARRPYGSQFDESAIELDVHPWERTSAARPWLLKAHGDVARSGDLVFSADEYEAFRDAHGPVASVLQSMFSLSREVLFVGYSLRDKNIRALMDEAVGYYRSRGVEHGRLGTVLDLESAGVERTDQLLTIGFRTGEESIGEAARRLEMFLDCLGWLTSRDEASWLLDGRYAALLPSEDRESAELLRELVLPASDVWEPVRRTLRDFGRRPY